MLKILKMKITRALVKVLFVPTVLIISGCENAPNLFSLGPKPQAAQLELTDEVKKFILREVQTQPNCEAQYTAEFQRLREEVAEFKKYRETFYAVVGSDVANREARKKWMTEVDSRLKQLRNLEAQKLAADSVKFCGGK